jgi:hypothetical protein
VTLEEVAAERGLSIYTARGHRLSPDWPEPVGTRPSARGRPALEYDRAAVDAFYQRKEDAFSQRRQAAMAKARTPPPTEDCVLALRDALAAITGISDREARARALTQALALMSTANGELSRLRREDIRDLHQNPGMSYREIGDAIGIHYSHAQQLATGKATGNSTWAREAKARAVMGRKDGAADE